MAESPRLYIFSGLPGTGKSTLATSLARCVGAMYLRIDTVEQALRDLYSLPVDTQGYELAYRVAADTLTVGVSVVADSCNPVDATRRQWEAVARAAGASYVNIEITCSDKTEHRRRVENRAPSVAGLQLPDWSQVERRLFEVWTGPRVRINTATLGVEEAMAELIGQLQLESGEGG